jgi:hypothetical protein
MNKGQGLSISTIVLAAIALLVLVILAVLILRAGTDTATGTQDCEAQGGKLSNTNTCSGDLNVVHPTLSIKNDQGQITNACCVDLLPNQN